MTSEWRTRIASLVATSLLAAALSFGCALGADSVRLEGDALAAAESSARAAIRPLAAGSPSIDSKQAFNVVDAGARTRVVPVQYSPLVPGPLANVDWCALAIMVDDRPVETVQTIGTGYTESVGCTDLDGIAFPDLDGDGRFEIALIYSTLAPPDRYGKTPVVVRRSKDGTFAVDAALGEALDQQGGITTLRALRQAATARLKEKD